MRTTRPGQRSSPRPARDDGGAASGGAVSLARALSKLGHCSRREAELLVEAGRVEVRGRHVLNPRLRVAIDSDTISVDGVVVRAPRARLVVAFHKPAGRITSRRDPAGRPTIYSLLTGIGQWVFPVGRLDRDTSGLLILTNDHPLGHALTDPEHRVAKVYHVRVRGVPSEATLAVLRQGVPLDRDAISRPAKVRSLGVSREGTAWIEITLQEGRNRQVRRMCSFVGHDVIDLVRVRIGGLGLGDLRPGEWRQLEAPEVQRLLAESPGKRPRRNARSRMESGRHRPGAERD